MYLGLQLTIICSLIKILISINRPIIPLVNWWTTWSIKCQKILTIGQFNFPNSRYSIILLVLPDQWQKQKDIWFTIKTKKSSSNNWVRTRQLLIWKWHWGLLVRACGKENRYTYFISIERDVKWRWQQSNQNWLAYIWWCHDMPFKYPVNEQLCPLENDIPLQQNCILNYVVKRWLF